MQAEIETCFTTLGWIISCAVALFFLRIILSIALRKRLAPGLVPEIDEVYRPESLTRFVSLIGHRAVVRETLGTHHLRATFGLKLVFWGVSALLVYVIAQMNASAIGIETLLLGFVVYLAIHTTLYEISYDRDSITLPRWWFGRTTRKWRDLDATVDRMGWYLDFHFRDGTVIQAHKYVVGYAGLRETARKSLREV